MKTKLLITITLLVTFAGTAQPRLLRLSNQQLKDKIKGGWAGQTIGVTFGGPYEFRYLGSFIQDYQPLTWYDGYIKKTMLGTPGLYDDLYMDLSFVEVIDRLGPDAPVDSFAQAFAHAEYPLWHANQAARYNILNGIKPPLSGSWINNPHADDIDFQIEADFAGLMCPGMPHAAAAIADKVGHIMNYGDGYYGGVYVATMYTLAFTSNDIGYIVREALKSIPASSNFYRCIADVIHWQQLYPDDWHRTWFELQKKWSSDKNCPDGVFDAFDIDATINAAYVVTALLYGKGDYTRTLEIATKAGQDADCNPSTAGGVLGTMLGYEKIPAHWKMGLAEAENIDFKYTATSLQKVYATGYRHALETIRRNGGTIEPDSLTIVLQTPTPVPFEQSFPNLYPVAKRDVGATMSFAFEGTGFVLRGQVEKKQATDTTVLLEITIDDGPPELIRLPTAFTSRKNELYWKYELPEKNHTVQLRQPAPNPDFVIHATDYIVYKPVTPRPISHTPAKK